MRSGRTVVPTATTTTTTLGSKTDRTAQTNLYNPSRNSIVLATMEFFEVIKKRRSIRRYTDETVPETVMRRALEAATLAPNSSNAQTWDFYWVKSPDKKAKLVKACLDQSAARTAAELVVVTANPKRWRRSWPYLKNYVSEINAPAGVKFYYEKLFPTMYRWGLFSSLGLVKGIALNAIGLFRPIVRGPLTKFGIQGVCIKSAALASENFVLAITAQGFSSCMMEGFDECRVKSLLNLGWSERVVMVIAVGRETERGTWGPQFRIPITEVVHEV